MTTQTPPTRTERLLAVIKRLDRWIYRDKPWWVFPAILVALGIGSTAAAATFYPSPYGDEWTFVFGMQFGDTCGMVKAIGEPCPQCGMTRSWTYGVRGDFVRAFWYNPAGVTLLYWMQAGAIVGGIRLYKRNPKAVKIPYLLLAGWAAFWMVFLYFLPWIGRVGFDINPLPLP